MRRTYDGKLASRKEDAEQCAVDADNTGALKRARILDESTKKDCGLVMEAMRSSKHLPETCRSMLIAGAEMSLGIPKSQRDEFQASVARFIGEVVLQVEEGLAAAVGKCEEDVRVAKAVGEPLMRQAEDSIAAARQELTAAQEAAKVCEATFDTALASEREAAESCKLAEASRSQCEEDLLAARRECDVCEAGCAFMLRGEGEIQVAELQRVTAKLKLEESLALMLPCMVGKTLQDRTALERTASDFLSAAIGKHAGELRTWCESEVPVVAKKTAEAEEAKKLHERAESCRQERAQSLEVARERVAKADANYKASETAREGCSSEIADLEKNLADACGELQHYRDGPHAAFQSLLESSGASYKDL
jgi:hypothetical protein